MSQDLKLYTLNRNVNPNAQFSIGNWVAFADAAGTAPVDGTGGAPAVTVTRTTATPLEGVASLLFTKDAANRQGQGISADIVLQASDATKMTTLTFDYQITTGTYTGYQSGALFSDLTVWVYDITNSVMYQATGYQVDGTVSTTNQYSYQGQWQVPVGCLQARVILFLGNTGASAFTARINNLSFGRLSRVQGTVSTPWISFTPTGTLTVNVTYTGYWRRVGSQGEYDICLTFSGVNTEGTLSVVNMPSGHVIDTASLSSGTGTNYDLGQCMANIVAASQYMGIVRYASTTTIQPRVFRDDVGIAGANIDSTGINTNTGVPGVIASGDTIHMHFTVPIVGWGANGTLGQDADTRVVAAKYGMGASYTFVNNNPLQFNTLAYDTHGAATYGAGVTFTYYVPVSGYYNYVVGIQSSNAQAVASLGIVSRLFALTNGTSFVGNFMGGQFNGGAASTFLIWNVFAGGHYITAGTPLVFSLNNEGASFSGAAAVTANYVSITRVSGPAQVQASEVPKAGYNTNAAQSIVNATTPIVDFEDKIYDTFGLVTVGTWKFTANKSGVLRVSAMVTFASGIFTLNNRIQLYLYKNGALYEGLNYTTIMATITDPISVEGGSEVQVIAGDYIDVRVSHGEITARALTSTATENYIAVSYTDGM